MRIENIPITVLRLTSSWITDPASAAEVRAEWSRLVEQGRVNLLMNLADVAGACNPFFGNLITVWKRLQACGGRLTLTNLQAIVFEKFTAVRLDKLIDWCHDENDALPQLLTVAPTDSSPPNHERCSMGTNSPSSLKNLPMEDYRHLRIQEVHVTLIRFADERLLDPVREIPEVGQELLRLADEGRTNLVLNFAGVDRVSSMFYSQLLALRKRLQTCGARLTLTNLCPFVQEIFRAFQADKLFDIRTDEADALPRKV